MPLPESGISRTPSGSLLSTSITASKVPSDGGEKNTVRGSEVPGATTSEPGEVENSGVVLVMEVTSRAVLPLLSTRIVRSCTLDTNTVPKSSCCRGSTVRKRTV